MLNNPNTILQKQDILTDDKLLSLQRPYQHLPCSILDPFSIKVIVNAVFEKRKVTTSRPYCDNIWRASLVFEYILGSKCCPSAPNYICVVNTFIIYLCVYISKMMNKHAPHLIGQIILVLKKLLSLIQTLYRS